MSLEEIDLINTDLQYEKLQKAQKIIQEANDNLVVTCAFCFKKFKFIEGHECED